MEWTHHSATFQLQVAEVVEVLQDWMQTAGPADPAVEADVRAMVPTGVSVVRASRGKVTTAEMVSALEGVEAEAEAVHWVEMQPEILPVRVERDRSIPNFRTRVMVAGLPEGEVEPPVAAYPMSPGPAVWVEVVPAALPRAFREWRTPVAGAVEAETVIAAEAAGQELSLSATEPLHPLKLPVIHTSL
jgi:hypothetical protein